MKKHSKSELIAECCVCGKQVPFNDGDRDSLLKHSQENHQGERVIRYDILKQETSSSTGKKSKRSDSKTSRSSRSSRGSIRKSLSEDSKKKKKGKSSDAEDGEADFKFGHRMVCSSCGHVGPPVLKRHGRSKARASLGMFAGCCPLLAMIAFFCCCTPRIAHLYCSRCKHYLGTYNTRNGKVTTVKEGG